MRITIFISVVFFFLISLAADGFAEEPPLKKETPDCEAKKIKVCILPIYDHADTSRTGDFQSEVLSTLTELIHNEYIEYEVANSNYYLNIMGGKSDNHKADVKQLWQNKQLNLEKANAYINDANADIAITYLINSTSYEDRFSCFLYDAGKKRLFEKSGTEDIGRDRLFKGYGRIKYLSRQLLDDYLSGRTDLKKIQNNAVCNINQINIVVLPFLDGNDNAVEYSKKEIVNNLKSLTMEEEYPYNLIGFFTNELVTGVVNLPFEQADGGFWVDNQPNVDFVTNTVREKKADLAIGYYVDTSPRENRYCCYLIDTIKLNLIKECGTDNLRAGNSPFSFASYGAIKNSSKKLFDRYQSMTAPPKPKVSLILTPEANAKEKIVVFPVYNKVTTGASYSTVDERRITTDLFDIFSEDLDMVLYSFYELYINKNKYVKIDEDSFGVETKDFWIKKSFWSSPEPNYDVMKKILRETDVDYGITLYIESGYHGCKYTAFIIDLKNNSVNQSTGTSSDQTHTFNSYSGIKDLTEDLIDQYLLVNERKIVQSQ